ncbi:MAG: hypothetical protein ABI478_06215 [Propionivibrio sp.]
MDARRQVTRTHDQTYNVPAIKAALQEKMGAYVADYPQHIEQGFPHVLARIAELWGTPQLDAYLDALLLPDRQERQGFPADVATEVFRLSAIHSEITFEKKATTSGWSEVVDADMEKKGFNSPD